MAAYPTLPTETTSQKRPVDSRVLVRATNGTLKARQLHPSEKSSFDLRHRLTSSQYSTLTGHYGTDAFASFSYTWPGSGGGTYTVMYAERPEAREFGGGVVEVRVILQEV